MGPSHSRIVARTAMLLALTLLAQSLRLLIPIPPFLSMFLIGSLVNACLILTVETAGLTAAMLISVIAPLVAYFQQFLPLPLFVLPVASANIIYVLLFKITSSQQLWLRIVCAAGIKTLWMYGSFFYLLSWIHISGKIAAGILFSMGWPQIITSTAGILMAVFICHRLRPLLRVGEK